MGSSWPSCLVTGSTPGSSPGPRKGPRSDITKVEGSAAALLRHLFSSPESAIPAPFLVWRPRQLSRHDHTKEPEYRAREDSWPTGPPNTSPSVSSYRVAVGPTCATHDIGAKTSGLFSSSVRAARPEGLNPVTVRPLRPGGAVHYGVERAELVERLRARGEAAGRRFRATDPRKNR